MFVILYADHSLLHSFPTRRSSDLVYCHPRITLYTLNFTRNENVKLASHLNLTFGTNFVVSNHPDGKGRDNKVRDRKSTRLNSSHVAISYAVFCLKKKKDHKHTDIK